jgi:hypothetical protein
VFWNTKVKNKNTGKPVLCNAKSGDGDYNFIHQCRVEKIIRRRMREEEEAVKNFAASVKESTRRAILGDDDSTKISSTTVYRQWFTAFLGSLTLKVHR